MSKTRIFVSSTCYDLSAVRESLREAILALGHEPILSEYSSFPVLPDLKTVENCKKVVRENSDLFLLIVGGKRGSLDPASGQSVVNVEYECADERGIDTFVFVRKSVLDLLPVWEQNPSGSFLPHVDSPDVFAFVKKLKAKHQWLFPFDKTADIKETVGIQLSVLLKELLGRKRAGKLDPLKEFKEESERAQILARDKPPYWEFLLTEDLLRTKLSDINRAFSDLERGLVFRKTRTLALDEATTWLAMKFHDLTQLTQLFQVAIPEEIPAAWGKKGEPGNAMAIKRSVDRVIDVCRELIEWETELFFVSVPERLQKVVDLMRGTTKVPVEEVNRLVEELAKPFKTSSNPSGLIKINLVFCESPNIALVNEELARITEGIRQRPWEWQ